MEVTDPHYRARHGAKGVLGEKGSVSALMVLNLFLDSELRPPDSIAADGLSSDQIDELVQATSDEFGLVLTPSEVSDDAALLKDGQTLGEFLSQWKVRANTARSATT